MDMEQLVNGSDSPPQPRSDEPKVDTPQDAAQQPQGDGAPTAPQQDSHVPLAALEAERKGRQDWKEKAIRAEEEAKRYQREVERLSQVHGQPPQQIDPMQSMQMQLVNERFNTSEMLIRSQHKDVDQKLEAFQDAARQNPALQAALQSHRHPWEFAYQEGARLLLQTEIGNDPQSYRERVRAEVMAELSKSPTAAQQPASLPQSLNGTRSVAPRAAVAFTGPTPFDSLVNNRQ